MMKKADDQNLRPRRDSNLEPFEPGGTGTELTQYAAPLPKK